MTSWRDQLTPAAQADLDRVLDASLRAAQSRLARASEFEPFGLLLDSEGRMLQAGRDDSTSGKHPDVDVVIAAVVEQMRHALRGAHATAIVLNSRLSKERTDAIEVRLEHREGVALLVLLPYKRPMFGAVEYSPARIFAGTKELWR